MLLARTQIAFSGIGKSKNWRGFSTNKIVSRSQTLSSQGSQGLHLLRALLFVSMVGMESKR